MDKKDILLKVLAEADGDPSFAIECLTDDICPSDAEFVTERIVRSSPNFEVQIGLEGWRRIYDAGMFVPTAVEAAIAHSRGEEHAGCLFTTLYYKAVSAVRQAAEDKEFGYDPELQALIEVAARELPENPGRGVDILRQFDMDRL